LTNFESPNTPAGSEISIINFDFRFELSSSVEAKTKAESWSWGSHGKFELWSVHPSLEPHFYSLTAK